MILSGMAAGCSSQTTPEEQKLVSEQGRLTVASEVAGDQRFGQLSWALADTQLAPVLDGEGDYTLLAFEDEGFDALNNGTQALTTAENRPVLAAILRAHILPGQITPQAIRRAIERKGGPVQMRTMAGSLVSFATRNDGDTLIVSNGEKSATLGEDSILAVNGAILPVGAVLVPPA